jgi:hypothetical protein
MATTPSYAATPVLDLARLSAANTSRDGTGTLLTVATGTTAGKRLSRVLVSATGTTTAGMIRFFLSTDNGTTNRLVAELPVTAITPSGTVASFTGQVDRLSGLILPGTTALLRATTHNAETFDITVESAGL